MNIKENLENEIDTITISVIGEVDGSNVKDLEFALKSALEKATNLVIDLAQLEYVSSAGLRVFLLIRKMTEIVGQSMVIRNVTEDVMEIFTVTGFVNLLTIET